jgi:hypothetical protein
MSSLDCQNTDQLRLNGSDITYHEEENTEEPETYRYCFTEADVASLVGTPRL